MGSVNMETGPCLNIDWAGSCLTEDKTNIGELLFMKSERGKMSVR